MQRNTSRRASIILGIFMAVVLLGGTLLQLFNNDIAATAPVQDATEVPIPTFPPPASVESYTFNENYFHPSGLFTIAQPTGFQASEPNSSAGVAQINMVSDDALMVVDAYVEDAGGAITADGLDARFTQAVLAQSWSRFNDWEELSRRRDGEYLLIDFGVTLQRQQYVARQKAWTDGEWIYVVRALAPENATDQLVAILDSLIPTLRPFKQFSGTPFVWQAYYDATANHIIRHPQTWLVTDSAPGRPASIESANGTVLRVEARANTVIADTAAAENFILAERAGATILSSLAITRGEVPGFDVAYSFNDADGEPQSGYALLLNGADGMLHIANLRFAGEAVDLNQVEMAMLASDAVADDGAIDVLPDGSEATAEATAEVTQTPGEAAAELANVLYGDLFTVMQTFYLLEPLQLSASSLPATPTPRPTLAPTSESTVEATESAEATESIEVTSDVTAETTAALEADVSTEAATAETVSTLAPTDDATDEVGTQEATELADSTATTGSAASNFAGTATAMMASRMTATPTP